MERSVSLGNVFRIFLRDIKRLAKVPPAWLVVIFLMVLPSLYSWLNIIGFWNPYDNTSNLRVCMVNEDAGAYDENLGQLNMGDQIADQLRDNDQLDWAFVDREEAMREVSAGEAYAAFVVPEDFSADVATLASGDFQQPQLLYYVNEKTGPVAPKITDTGANTLDTTINETFFSTVSGAVADALDDFLAASGTKLDAARSGAAGRVGNARADIAEARAALAELATTSSGAADEALSAKDTLDSARSSLAALSTTFENVASLSESANTELGKLTASTGTALDEGSASLAQTSASAALALGNASAKIGAAEGTVSAALERGRAVVQENEQVISQLRELKQYTQTSEADEAIERIVAPVEQVDAELTRVMDNLGTQATDLSTTAKATADASSAIDAAVHTSLGNVDAYRTFLTNNTVPTLSEGIGRTASLSGDLGMAIARQQSLVDEASGALDGLHATLLQAATALDQTSTLLSDFENELASVETDLSALRASGALAQLVGEDGLDSSKIADFMMAPTQVETEELYPLNAYGSAMAPLFINLTLWIGVFMLMVIVRLEVDDEGLERLTIAQRFFGRALLLAPLAAIQAAVCCTGCLVIGVQTASVPLFYLTAIGASLSYLSIQYTLSSSLQHVGKGLCVILVFVQIPAATGLYPIEMTNGFFQTIYPMFPFTYGINAIRETISGFYGTAWHGNMAVLMGFLVAFAVLGAVARTYLANLNRLFARQIEESDIITGEAVELPARRYRLSQIVRTLANREEYRTAINGRMERFLALYPRLRVGSIAIAVLFPIVLTCILAAFSAEKVVILTSWLVWFFAAAVFFIVVEFWHDNLDHLVSLESMSDAEVRTLYSERNRFTKVRPLAESSHRKDDAASEEPQDKHAGEDTEGGGR